MIKTVRVVRGQEPREDFSWALKLDDGERVECATNLICELWRAAHGVDFPRMERGLTRLIAHTRPQDHSPTRKHRHGPGGNKCIWCGSTSNGSGSIHSPTGKHEK